MLKCIEKVDSYDLYKNTLPCQINSEIKVKKVLLIPPYLTSKLKLFEIRVNHCFKSELK